MNIFVSSSDPYEAAKFLDDKRVVKMVLESAQMLSTALNHYGFVGPYRSTHANHPCSVWVRETKTNYLWLLYHFQGLLAEYTNRYGKVHKCAEHLEEFYELGQFLPPGPRTPFPNCARNKSLGIDYTGHQDVFTAYKLYLNDRWDTDKRQPTWYKEAK